MHYRPRTPAVAIALSGLGVKHCRGVTPQHDAPTNHDPTHHHLICWCEGTLPHDTTAGLRSLILREDRAGPGTRVNPSPSSIMRHHRVSERIPPPRGERPSNAQRIARANPIRDAHASPGTYRAPASPAPRRSCGEHVAWHTGGSAVSWSKRDSDWGEVARRVGVSLTTSRRMCLTATASSRVTMCSQPTAGSPRTRASWVLGR